MKLILYNSEGEEIKEMPFGEKRMTNEEWLKSLDTKELAKWIRRKTHGNDEYNEEVELAWEGWLQEEHNELSIV